MSDDADGEETAENDEGERRERSESKEGVERGESSCALVVERARLGISTVRRPERVRLCEDSLPACSVFKKKWNLRQQEH